MITDLIDNRAGQTRTGLRVFFIAFLLPVLLLILSSSVLAKGGPGGIYQDVKSEAKRVVQMIIDEEFSDLADRFDENLAQTLDAEKLETSWRQLKSQAGSFQRIVSVTSRKERGYDIVDVKCQFEGGGIMIQVVFNPNLDISGLWLAPGGGSNTPSSPTQPENDRGAGDRNADRTGSSGDPKSVAREVVNMKVRGDFSGVARMFDSNMRNAVTADQMRQGWQSIINQVGAFQRIIEMNLNSQGGYDTVDIKCQCQRGFIYIRVVINRQQEIAGLWVQPGSN
jgi:hypothetical protein